MPEFRQRTVRTFLSPEALVRALEAPGAEGYRGRHQWSNKDLDPTPAEDRKWSKWDYGALWWGSSFNALNWASGSALVSVGLNFTQAMGTSLVGSALASAASVINARQGALYHVGYPITIRSQMGVFGGYFFVFLRAIVACVWFGIQSYYTGRLFSVALRCIFGDAWMKLRPFPASAGITSQDFTAFMLVYLLQLPLMFIHPANIRRLFEFKAIVIPPCAIALTVWTCVKAGGFSKFDLATTTTIHGSALFWVWMKCINAVIANTSPLIINQPDLARYSMRPSEAGWYQGCAMFVVKNLVAFLSIATTSALKVMYGGPALWNLWDQLDAILDHEWNAGGRAGVFLVAIMFVFATILTNISANSIPFGADFTGVVPRFLTIRRGQVVCWVLGLAIVPWKFMVDAAKFITFLGSYTILMGALFGVIACDFFVIRRGNIHIPSCYTGDRNGLYYFWRGINWRGCTAWLCGFIIPFPGLLGAYGASVSKPALRMYESGWILSVTIAFAVHYALNRLSPVPVYPASHSDAPVKWEHLGDQTRNGVFEDELWTGPADDAALPTVVAPSPAGSLRREDDVYFERKDADYGGAGDGGDTKTPF